MCQKYLAYRLIGDTTIRYKQFNWNTLYKIKIRVRYIKLQSIGYKYHILCATKETIQQRKYPKKQLNVVGVEILKNNEF